MSVFKQVMKPIIEDISKGTLRRQCKYFNMYCEVQSRKEYLQKIRSMFRSKEDNDFSVKRIDEDFTMRSVQYKLHWEFVAETFDLLDINNTIDHPTNTLDMEWIYKDWKTYVERYPLYVLDAMFDVPLKDGTYMDEAAKILVDGMYAMRKGMYEQRLKHEVKLRHSQGWYFVFDTLTLSPEQIKSFVDDKNAIRDYCRKIGRLVNKALGLKAKDSYSDNYKYFIVPEYGDKNGRLHFHCLHIMRELPLNSFDPNLGRKVRNNRLVNTLRNLWKYGYSMPISVRYQRDSFTMRRGWLHPVDKNGTPLQLKPVDAVCAYITKYVAKQTNTKKSFHLRRLQEKWKISLKEIQLQSKVNRVRMSRNFGMTLAPMRSLSMDTLQELTKLSWQVTPYSLLLKEMSRRELCSRVKSISIAQLVTVLPQKESMLKLLRNLIRQTPAYSLRNSILFQTPSLIAMDISKETLDYLKDNGYYHEPKVKHSVTFGSK